MKALNYAKTEYPKGNNVNYILGERARQKVTDNNTGETWYE